MSEKTAKAARKAQPPLLPKLPSTRPTQASRILAIVNAEIDRVKLADNVTHADVLGPSPVVMNGTVAPIWTVVISLKHNMLVGQPDIVTANSLTGDLMPTDDEFRKIAVLTLEQARAERDRRNAGGQ